ncbi:hypothetical protein BD289DRAFT_153712 [Coniella lustricola]|uniref:Uncharacterized protein n=1 Tax=Coniella lustricola TaxID=2025994 RepID=A0A2T3AMC3_9PEZI|nr:hypothetical protein BD289DRAFT_153712 [Coniella lustricola]
MAGSSRSLPCLWCMLHIPGFKAERLVHKACLPVKHSSRQHKARPASPRSGSNIRDATSRNEISLEITWISKATSKKTTPNQSRLHGMARLFLNPFQHWGSFVSLSALSSVAGGESRPAEIHAYAQKLSHCYAVGEANRVIVCIQGASTLALQMMRYQRLEQSREDCAGLVLREGSESQYLPLSA